MPRVKPNDEALVEQMREVVNGTRAAQEVVVREPSESERLERVEHAVQVLRKDVDELRYLFTRMNNAFMNGELQGYAQQTIYGLDQRVRSIENYLRYITTGSVE